VGGFRFLGIPETCSIENCLGEEFLKISKNIFVSMVIVLNPNLMVLGRRCVWGYNKAQSHVHTISCAIPEHEPEEHQAYYAYHPIS